MTLFINRPFQSMIIHFLMLLLVLFVSELAGNLIFNKYCKLGYLS